MNYDNCVLVVFAYEGDGLEVLSIEPGDVVTVVERREGEWWSGQLRGKEGFFPHPYTTALPPRTCTLMCTANNEFDPKEAGLPENRLNEFLTLSTGDRIVVFDNASDGDWWTGVCNSRFGFFGTSFVLVEAEKQLGLVARNKQRILEKRGSAIRVLSQVAPKSFPSNPPPSPHAARANGGGSVALQAPQESGEVSIENRSIILKVQLPGKEVQKRSKAMKFQMDDRVGDVLRVISEKVKGGGIEECDHAHYGLYIPPPMSMWCNENLPLHSYHLDNFDVVVFGDKRVKMTSEKDDDEDDPERVSTALVLWNFKATSTSQMTVEQGALLEVVDKVSEDWWECRSTSGRPEQGFVPRSYLSLVVNEEEQETKDNVPGRPSTPRCEGTQQLSNYVCRLLVNDPQLTSLTFTRCCFSETFAANLAGALEPNEVLTKLRLHHHALQNPETTLPMLVSSFPKQLCILDLSSNSLHTLPAQICNLQNLEELYVNNNHLTSLPVSIGMLTNLQILDAASNKISTFPEQLHLCQNLRILNFKHNKLTSLPSSFLSLKKLESVCVSHNPVKGIPKEIVERGDRDLIHYLENMIDGSTKVYRMKLMVVGQENVGKTSLLRCLKKTTDKKSGKVKKDEHNVATDGIDIQVYWFA